MNEETKINLPKAFDNIPFEIAEKIYREIVDTESSVSIHDFTEMIDFFRLQATTNDEAQKKIFDLGDVSYCFRVAIWILNFLSAEDPSQLHYHAARKILKGHGDGSLESDENARDILARALVQECRSFAEQLIPKENLQENTSDHEKSMSFKGLLNPGANYLIYPVEGKLWLDELFLSHLSKIGPEGEKAARQLSGSSERWYKEFLEDKKALGLFRFWVDLSCEPYYCRFPEILATVLWKERIEESFRKTKKQLPALTQSVSRPVIKFLSSTAQIETSKDSLSVAYDGKVIGEIAAIDPKLMSIITKGSRSLNSIYHHKLIRFECKSGFINWAEKKPDVRVLRFDGGVTEITERLGFKFKEAPATIKALLHAQALMNFYFDDGSQGNLIALRKFKSRKTRREEGVEIVLGTQLMPYYTFQTDKRSRLLVPVPELPPLVSAPQYHAGQALLQMLVMSEFTNNSMDLALEGAIQITEKTWEEFQIQSGLPISVFKKAFSRWLCDGDDGGRFLIKVDRERYTLGEDYFKELEFLQAQGRLRLTNKKKGQLSAQKKKNRAKK